MKIVYHPRAIVQIDEIVTYIDQQDAQGAKNVAFAIKRGINRLARFPYLGRPWNLPGVRVLSITRYP